MPPYSFLICSIILGLSSISHASVSFVSPPPGASLTPGVISIKWKDDGQSPSISDLVTYGINLCAGGNSDGSFDCTLAHLVLGAHDASKGSATGTVPADAGASSPGVNAYFLQFVGQDAEGGQTTVYSSRFAMTGLTGKFTEPAVAPAIAALPADTTEGPSGLSTLPSVSDGADAGSPHQFLGGEVGETSVSGEVGPFAVPYTMQTGLTRYAPMQPQPGTKITAVGSPSPLWPTSSVVLATTWLPAPIHLTTVTQAGTYSVSSMENTAAPLPGPASDMRRFLERWKD